MHPLLLCVVPSGHLVLLSPLVLDVVGETAGEVDLGIVVDVASNLGNRTKLKSKVFVRIFLLQYDINADKFDKQSSQLTSKDFF